MTGVQTCALPILVEHVFGGLAEVDDALAQVGGADAEGHVLGVAGAGGVIVAADAANPAGDEMGVARVLALQEDAVAAKDRRRAFALDDLLVGEIDLGVNAETAYDPRDGVPGHADELFCLGGHCVPRRFWLSASVVGQVPVVER